MNSMSLSNARAKAKKNEFAGEGEIVEFESKIDLMGEATYFANDIDSKMKFEELWLFYK